MIEIATLPEAAAAYAARGWYVFPLITRDKRPATRHGLHDATCDPKLVAAMWRASPRANIGINCGRSGLLVVDLDGDTGRDNWADVAARHGGHQTTLLVDTSGGGRHIYFNGAGPSTAGRIAPGVDTRGSGGYVIAPPSVHPSGRLYLFTNDPATPTADTPEWLHPLLAKPLRPAADQLTHHAQLPHHVETTPLGHTTLQGLRAQVANAPEGTRNRELYNCTLRAGRVALRGDFNLEFAQEVMLDAAAEAGLEPRETRLTIASGIATAHKLGPAAPPPARRG